MLWFIILLVMLVNITSLICNKKSDVFIGKLGFYSGLFGIFFIPFSVVGVFLTAFNIQGVFGNLNGFLLVFLIAIASSLCSLFSIVVFLKDKPVNVPNGS